jgi:dipeptidase E
MKYLLTSGGVRNPSIQAALVELLGKPIAEASALCIPTASYGHPAVTPDIAMRFLTGETPPTMTELGWKSLGLLELTALPSIEKERWVSWVEEADVLLVNGGDALYLSYWMQQSGLAALLPSLHDKVWVGMSAGSMIMTPHIGEAFVQWKPPMGGDDSTLGIVNFSIFPHLDYEGFPENTMAHAERWAAGLSNPSYAIDDETAIKVVGDTVEVISEGHWKYFTPSQGALR